MTLFDMVGAFHQKFGLDYYSQGNSQPTLLDSSAYEFRLKFMEEELREYREAHEAGDLVKAADSLADLVYVALGTAHLHRVPFNEVFAEVQRANMTKERSTGDSDSRSTRKHFLDVVKPEGWKPPNIRSVIERAAKIKPMSKGERTDQRYFSLAQYVAGWSKDPSTKVGCVIVGRDPREVALGYNGFPPGIEDKPERLNDRDTRYRLTQHGERNVLDNARFDVRGGTLYSTQIPCSECAKSVVSKGIFRVVCPPAPNREPWKSDSEWSKMILSEAKVVLDETLCL